MSPEYALDGLFSLKSDVFSFGVVVIEIISGKRSTGFFEPEQALSLLGYVCTLQKHCYSKFMLFLLLLQQATFFFIIIFRILLDMASLEKREGIGFVGANARRKLQKGGVLEVH